MKLDIKQQTRQTVKTKDSFDVRIVRYEYIHSIKDEFFDELVRIVDPQNGQNVLDAGCGYGAVTREILKRIKNKKLNCFLSDANYIQLKRAKEELENIDGYKSETKFFIDNLIDTKFEENTFDTIIAKMVIHEIPAQKQQKAIDNTYRILKQNGRLIIWDMALDDDTQNFIQEVIRMKDKLAGFKTLEKNRYFLRFDEIKTLLLNAGFKKIKKEYEIVSPVITHKRIDQEFGNNKVKLNKWHNFIRERAERIKPDTLKRMEFKDEGESISFVPPKAIITAIK